MDALWKEDENNVRKKRSRKKRMKQKWFLTSNSQEAVTESQLVHVRCGQVCQHDKATVTSGEQTK